MLTLEEIKDSILNDLSQRMTQSGIMFRIFGRAKSLRSLEHKMQIKGDKYRDGHVSKIVVGRNVEQVDKRKPNSGIFIPKMIRDDKDHREHAQYIEFLNPFFHMLKIKKEIPRLPTGFL